MSDGYFPEKGGRVRIQYRGPDVMKLSGHGFQLFHGVHYNVEFSTLRNKRIHVVVSDGACSTTGMYNDMDAVGKDWCLYGL